MFAPVCLCPCGFQSIKAAYSLHLSPSFLSGPSHSISNPGSIWVWLHRLPRTSIPRSDCVSWSWRDGGKHFHLFNHVKGSPGGLHVGEYTHAWRANPVIDTPRERGSLAVPVGGHSVIAGNLSKYLGFFTWNRFNMLLQTSKIMCIARKHFRRMNQNWNISWCHSSSLMCEINKQMLTWNICLCVFLGCRHCHWRATSIFHGQSSSSVRCRPRWWRLWGVWGDAGAGWGCSGQSCAHRHLCYECIY